MLKLQGQRSGKGVLVWHFIAGAFRRVGCSAGVEEPHLSDVTSPPCECLVVPTVLQQQRGISWGWKKQVEADVAIRCRGSWICDT